jgi:hypothetical protein
MSQLLTSNTDLSFIYNNYIYSKSYWCFEEYSAVLKTIKQSWLRKNDKKIAIGVIRNWTAACYLILRLLAISYNGCLLSSSLYGCLLPHCNVVCYLIVRLFDISLCGCLLSHCTVSCCYLIVRLFAI